MRGFVRFPQQHDGTEPVTYCSVNMPASCAACITDNSSPEQTTGPSLKSLQASRAIAVASLLALIALTLAWEIWLAPLRPGGSLLALKALPLALPLGGVLSARRYSFQWSSLLILAYLLEGLVRCWSDESISRLLAFLEVALALAYLSAAISYVRASRRPHGAGDGTRTA